MKSTAQYSHRGHLGFIKFTEKFEIKWLEPCCCRHRSNCFPAVSFSWRPDRSSKSNWVGIFSDLAVCQLIRQNLLLTQILGGLSVLWCITNGGGERDWILIKCFDMAKKRASAQRLLSCCFKQSNMPTINCCVWQINKLWSWQYTPN